MVRRLGYDQLRQGFDAVLRMPRLNIQLTRLATLEHGAHQASQQSIYGAVGAAKDLHPLADAMINVVGLVTQYNADSTGRFFIPIKNAGSYMVRVHAPGYDPQVFSVTVPENRATEIAPLLDPASGGSAKLEMASYFSDARGVPSCRTARYCVARRVDGKR